MHRAEARGPWEPVSREWFSGPTLDVAERLLGMLLVHETPEGAAVARIVEVEAYRGPEDRGAHSYGGRRTPRTTAMFGPPGHAYVFRVYGLHVCFNVVTADVDEPEAVLVRAAEPIAGLDLMARRRGLPEAIPKRLTTGPARLTQALGITMSHYGHPLFKPPLYIAPGLPVPQAAIARGPRIGIDYAGEWRDRPWRLFIRDSPFVSRG